MIRVTQVRTGHPAGAVFCSACEWLVAMAGALSVPPILRMGRDGRFGAGLWALLALIGAGVVVSANSLGWAAFGTPVPNLGAIITLKVSALLQLLAGAACFFVAMRASVFFLPRVHPGLCPECEYDLRGQAETGCPECGWHRKVSAEQS